MKWTTLASVKRSCVMYEAENDLVSIDEVAFQPLSSTLSDWRHVNRLNTFSSLVKHIQVAS